ncbi:DUF167 domain-containing protein [Candidatus Pacearchaeota archaeon]|nr:DUF167 domain-containing protein [Candidatus Pacearchaeota archaeon]
MIIRIKVKPNSNKEAIKKISENEYFIELKEPAKNNKANIRIINLLAKLFKINHGAIKIKNPSSKYKLIEVKIE